jgi:two-component system copper resistance phosphate regulon response regulator CusR
MRILVAEDHPNLAQSLVEGLRDEGYAVDLAQNGEDALRMAQVEPYDCVVLDIMLPGRDGFEVLQALRKGGRETPVLCLTARDAVEDRVKGLDLGADDYLLKPFAWEELLARVRTLIRRRHGQAAAVIQVGDLEIDTGRKSVRRGERVIKLSAREYGLLEYLAHRRGQVVSRTDVWEHLYDANDQTTSNVVDVYIGYLRRKVDDGETVKLIHTRRGQGYVLDVESP